MPYINKIAVNNLERWPFNEGNNRIRMYLNDRWFNFRVGRTNWSSIGATPRTFFLLAYQYGLLKLTSLPNYHYPGLLIIDFPPLLADGQLSTSENYLIQPFIDLHRSLQKSVQVIIAGKAFDGLKDIHFIKLEGSYK